jgi:hypothetical protein
MTRFGKLRSLALALVGLTAALVSTACTSTDRHLYESTVMRPTNVAVADATTGNVLWSYEIPVGYAMLLDFEVPGQIEPLKVNDTPAKLLKWSLRPITGKTDPFDDYPLARAEKKGRVELPGVDVIQRVSLRPAPEYPEGYVKPETANAKPATAPAPTPAPETAPAPAPEATPATQPATESTPAPAPVEEAAPAGEPAPDAAK